MAQTWPGMGFGSRSSLLSVGGVLLFFSSLSRMMKKFSVDSTSDKINKLLARSSWPVMMMGPYTGYRNVAHCTEKVTLHLALVSFATYTRFSWSEFSWMIFSSVELSGRGQPMLQCNELVMGVPSSWWIVCGDLEGRTWLHAGSETR